MTSIPELCSRQSSL